MKEEIIRNMLNASLAKPVQDADSAHSSLLSRRESTKEQLKHVTELAKQISAAIGLILERSTKVPDSSRAAFLESEIRAIDLRLQAMPQQIAAEINKITGSIEAIEYHISVLKGLPAALEIEISRAREIQEMQESGALKEKRKPGDRPVRMKDVRNYSSEDSDKSKE